MWYGRCGNRIMQREPVNLIDREMTMGKSRDTKKDVKKKPAKSLKEKRKEKQDKKKSK
jgi:hypothetical protein